MGFLNRRYLFWCAHCDDFSAVFTALGSQVDDPVGGFDDINVVFDSDDCVASIDEFIQYFEEFLDVVKMEACRRFVHDVER